MPCGKQQHLSEVEFLLNCTLRNSRCSFIRDKRPTEVHNARVVISFNGCRSKVYIGTMKICLTGSKRSISSLQC